MSCAFRVRFAEHHVVAPGEAVYAELTEEAATQVVDVVRQLFGFEGRSLASSSRSGDAGGDEQTPDLVLVDDLHAELLGLGGLARADAGAADQHVGAGRHR